MAHIDEVVKQVMENGLASKTPHEAEIKDLMETIRTEKERITGEYTKIGELYCKLHPKKTDGEIGALVSGVAASKKTIGESKRKIGELLGYNFCPECGDQVDDDALFCNNCGAKMPVKLMPGMVLCKHCNKAVREGIRFCTNCGKPMIEEEAPKVKRCPSCGFETEDMTKMFCDECGRRLEGDENEEEVKAKEEKKEPIQKVCTSCGFRIFDAETMFCNDCGRRLVPESEVNQ